MLKVLRQKLPDHLGTSLGVRKSLDTLYGIVSQDQRFSLEMFSRSFLDPAASAARGKLVFGNGIKPGDRRCFPRFEPSRRGKRCHKDLRRQIGSYLRGREFLSRGDNL
jgi:hypothetical protein